MRRKLFFILFLFSTFTGVFGQSKAELINRAVFNKLEFFINTQMTDSIYSLASDNFKKQIPAEQMAFVLNKLYQLGTVKQVDVVDFKQNTATYLLQFDEHALHAKLALDSSLHYELLAFVPAEKPIAKKTEKSEVISNVEKVSPLDFYIDSLANSYVKKGNAQSLSIAMFHQNSYKTFFYGETEQGNQTLPIETSLYEIGSITKVFTAVLLADLVTKNSVQLDDPIGKFLPDSVAQNPAIQGITLKQLANHTSSLPRLADNWNTVADFDERDPYAAYDRKALFSFLKQFKGGKNPGEEYEYSNLGYGLLGELISIITKKPYMQYLQETLLSPLQMTSTLEKADPKKKQAFLKVYDEEGNETPVWNWKAMIGAGGLKSNVKDLTLFAVEQFKMPSDDLQKAMALTRQFTFFTPNNMDIGLAWHMSMLDGIIYYRHTGGTAGSSSFIGLSPDTKTSLVVLSNQSESVEEISVAIMERLLEQAEKN
ncbi:serine hydrolase domain-containing protein [Sphingobacterium paludis]|uniref:CubicO group peptidase (Beta-lactamase class C family) n=1 Tax=Sphingobacterium paludis TaxID=1476465 RepID=A0A4R7D557_9SPHI|nr:serine hydrolase domain-containing protein [Sphingobacterium paludis]TDS16253.1 CubicO group peptidase (beta-lactamase class C family) [Sphingobacterium paludis]